MQTRTHTFEYIFSISLSSTSNHLTVYTGGYPLRDDGEWKWLCTQESRHPTHIVAFPLRMFCLYYREFVASCAIAVDAAILFVSHIQFKYIDRNVMYTSRSMYVESNRIRNRIDGEHFRMFFFFRFLLLVFKAMITNGKLMMR